MKVVASLFLVLLWLVHYILGFDQSLALPLSFLRDGDIAGLGYVLFLLLIIGSCWYTVKLTRCDEIAEAGIAGLSTVLLIVVAATPTINGMHEICAFLLLGTLFCNFWVVLYHQNSLWVFVHLATPLLIVILTRFHSYGLWQKCIISYFLLASMLRDHFLRVPAKQQISYHGGQSKRVVYKLNPDQ